MTDKESTFIDTNDHLVVIMSNVRQRLLYHRQLHSYSNESAGVLIGERRGSHIIICDLTEPGSEDIQHRYSVNRKGKHHQTKVNDAFILSKGTQQYLGEWHTHPEDFPSPSFIDKQSWKNNIEDSSPMIVIIVGRKRIWVGKKNGNYIAQLKKLEN